MPVHIAWACLWVVLRRTRGQMYVHFEESSSALTLPTAKQRPLCHFLTYYTLWQFPSYYPIMLKLCLQISMKIMIVIVTYRARV